MPGTQNSVSIEQITTESPFFSSLLNLRADAYGREEAGHPEEIDGYSHHFIARINDEVVGALRVTCRKHGPLESERFYPQWLLGEFGDQICASSRMCVCANQGAKSSIPQDLTRFAWSVVLPLGIRLDVSKARLKAIPFYMRMGYYFVRDSVFEFERWNVRCALIAYPATPYYHTALSEVFRWINDHCDLTISPHAHMFCSSYREFVNATTLMHTEEK